MLLDQIHELKAPIESLVNRCGAQRLRVFGSVARRAETPQSDIDFVVDLPRGYDLFAQRVALAQGLSDLLHRRVDLIPEHELNPHIRAQVLAEAVEL